jgi:hypothetical protein
MAMTIADIRQNYPQYQHLSDQDLADRLHEKFYPEMDKSEYYNKIGFSAPNQNSIQNQPISANKQMADSMITKLHNMTGTVESYDPFAQLSKNVAAGLASGVKGLLGSLPDTSEMGPDNFKKAYPTQERPIDKFDPYKTFGVEDKPFYTPQGAIQTAASLAVPLPPIAKAGGNLINDAAKFKDSLSPAKYATDLSDSLKSGSKNIQEAGKDIATAIKQKYADRISEPKVYYDFLDKHIGDGKIFQKPDPLISTEMDKEKPLLNKIKDLNIGDLYDNFKANPNYRNAHALQSEMGLLENELHVGVIKGTTTRAEMNKVSQLKNELQGSIKDYLERKSNDSGINYSGMYDTATNLYRENVAPYISSPKLRQLTRQGKTSIDNIENIFANPHDFEHPVTGKKQIGPVNKILQELPEDIKNKILYRNIKDLKEGNELSYVDKLKTALSGDFAHLGNENIFKKMADVENRAKNKKNLLKALPYATGGLVSTGGAIAGVDIFNHLTKNSGQ